MTPYDAVGECYKELDLLLAAEMGGFNTATITVTVVRGVPRPHVVQTAPPYRSSGKFRS